MQAAARLRSHRRLCGTAAFNAGVGEKARADARIILEGIKNTTTQTRNSTNAFGFNSGGPAFFRELMQQQPQMFSQQNRDAVNNGRAPIVDPQWVQYNPTHQSFSGTKLIHHHWMQGNIAVAIPEPVHQTWNRTFHPYR